jgi:hypothetical protein
MVVEPISFEDGEKTAADEHFKQEMLGPQMVTEFCNQMISVAWRMLPPQKRNLDSLEAYVRRVVERTLQNLRDDYTTLE